jgi:hypothetical protein
MYKWTAVAQLWSEGLRLPSPHGQPHFLSCERDVQVEEKG